MCIRYCANLERHIIGTLATVTKPSLYENMKCKRVFDGKLSPFSLILKEILSNVPVV
jgi:hypothetical protein